jgi:uncharacterized CHY-type Zn-finger protein
MERTVAGLSVRGVAVDEQTRCTHYDGPRDVVALRFPCCETYHPCFRCHAAVADHEPAVWPTSAFDRAAVLCGVCGTELRIEEYLGTTACPDCAAAFNPGCRNHYDRYFAVEGTRWE